MYTLNIIPNQCQATLTNFPKRCLFHMHAQLSSLVLFDSSNSINRELIMIKMQSCSQFKIVIFFTYIEYYVPGNMCVPLRNILPQCCVQVIQNSESVSFSHTFYIMFLTIPDLQYYAVKCRCPSRPH